jgi:uncharacterized protein YjdB
MKNLFKYFGIIALITVLGLVLAACPNVVAVAVKGVTLNQNSLSLTVGGTATLTATVAPSSATNKEVTWSSSNANVAAVNSGAVTAVSAGSATITVTTADGGNTATCAVTVTGGGGGVAVTNVSLNQNSLSLTVGGTATLTATVAPSNAANKAVNWVSSNTAVATVSGGMVTAVSVGTATITVTTADGGKTDTCAVTVISGGSGNVAVTNVTLDQTSLSLTVGGTATLTATVAPSNATNPNVTWSSSNESVVTMSGGWGSDSSATNVSGGTFTAVSAGTATITVSTIDGGKKATCVVTVTSGGGGENGTYIITGSGTSFTATNGGATIGSGAIQDVINAIRTHATGKNPTIQFGNGNVLDIGTSTASFNNTGGTWGLVTLTGKITSSNSSASSVGTIHIGNSVSVTSTADIANRTENGYAIYNNSPGAVNITGGTVSATTGVAVYNNSTGKITVSGTAKVTSANTDGLLGTIYLADNGTATAIATRLEITGGTVENTSTGSGYTVHNASSGAVSISGGTVSKAGSGNYAVYNRGSGTVTIGAGATIVGQTKL